MRPRPLRTALALAACVVLGSLAGAAALPGPAGATVGTGTGTSTGRATVTVRSSLPLLAEGAPPAVVAHRGASSLAPENTIAAQEIARRSGADFIENDVRLSQDGVPHLMHDATVDRTTDSTGPIATLSSAQLRALDAGSWFAPVFAGARVPTLTEQLADLRTRGGNLLLEIKRADDIQQVAAIIDIVRVQEMTDRVLIQSFDPQHLRWVRTLAPDLPLGLLRNTLDPDPVAVSRELRLALYNPAGTALEKNPGVVDQLHQAGVGVWVWTLDTAEKWDRHTRYGVDGIITNRPGELIGFQHPRSTAGVPRTGPPGMPR